MRRFPLVGGDFHPNAERRRARMGLALCVMMALALGAVMAGRPERMRSLVDPGPLLAA